MGKETGNAKENTLIDFLYKDLDLINSFYSQIFQGALSSITKIEMASDVVTSEANLSVGFAGGKMTSNETTNESITSNINPLDAIMQKLGGGDFSYTEFKDIASEILQDRTDADFRRLLLLLFENGYLGQVMSFKTYDKELKRNKIVNQAIFKHKKPTTKIDYSCKFSVHKGLYRALNIVKK